MTNYAIVEILNKSGMHWDPTTNSRYIGTPISEEDAKYIAPLNGTPAKL